MTDAHPVVLIVEDDANVSAGLAVLLGVIFVVPAVLGNFLIPIMIGAKDLAFPRINLLSWYLYIIGGIMMVHCMLTGGVDTGRLVIKGAADTIKRLTGAKYMVMDADVPVVVCPAGLTLGGGCEILMHGDRVQAAAETYLGLVEAGVGLIPAGGPLHQPDILDVPGQGGLGDVHPSTQEELLHTIDALLSAAARGEPTYLDFLDTTGYAVLPVE